jgi:hypothetical protein
MPFDSNGNFTRTQNWTSDFENGIEIVCDRHDDEDDNFANGFNECMLRDGRAPATGNLKMGNFRITGMADGQTSNDAVNKGQLDAQNMALKSADTELEKKINTKANLTLDNLDDNARAVINALIDAKLNPVAARSVVPDWSKYQDISENTYTAPKDGWIYWRGGNSGGVCKVNNVQVCTSGNYYDQPNDTFMVGKGDVITCNNKTFFRFIPFKAY